MITESYEFRGGNKLGGKRNFVRGEKAGKKKEAQ